MIRIIHNEESSNIKIDVEPRSDDGRMNYRDLVLHMVCIVVGMASFIRKATADENIMNRFFDTIRDADFADMIPMLVDDIEEKE